MTTVIPPVPDSEARQAIDAIGGYAYQLYQSLLAWVALDSSEMLFLEVAEDYAVATSERVEAVQVRRTQGNISLGNDKVLKALNAYWDLKEKNKDRSVKYRYLTTSGITQESKLSFPEGKSGLQYWREAAKPGVDVEPLRTALLTLDLCNSLRNFVETASAEELRSQLIIPINWDTNQPDSQSLAQQAEAMVTAKAQDIIEAPVHKAGLIVNCLLGELLKIASQKECRELSPNELAEIVKQVETVTISRDLAQKYQSLADVFIGKDGTPLQLQATKVETEVPPLPYPLTTRPALLNDVTKIALDNGVVFIYGSSGKGKSTLAKLLADKVGGNWVSVDLREHSPESSSQLMGLAASAFKSDSSYILDDLSLDDEKRIEKNLSIIAQKTNLNDRLLVVTTNSKPSSRLVSQLKKSASIIVDMPDLTIAEVIEIANQLGGDGQAWGPITHALCGGHPQLVVARLSGLADRGWPKEELMAGFISSMPATEIDDERANVRKQILNELESEKRQLLERLSLIGGRFDLAMAQAVCETPPPVANVVDNLTLLQGKWIEKMDKGFMRLSPLLSGLAKDKLSVNQIKESSARLATSLLKRVPLDGSLLMSLFFHALVGKHDYALARIAMLVLNSERAQRKYIIAQLGVLEGLELAGPILPENPSVSLFLRLAQFKVAVENESWKHADAIAVQTVKEARALASEEHGAEMLAFAYVVLLSEERMPFALTNWLEMLEEHVELTSNLKGEYADRIKDVYRNHEIDVPHFMFVLGSQKRRTVSELKGIFDKLDSMEKGRRDYFLSSLKEAPGDINIFIANAWLHESLENTLDAREASATYQEMAKMALAWEQIDLAIQCIVASSVMQDEYLHDQPEALTIVENALARLGKHVELLKQKGKVLHNQKEYAEALKVYGEIDPAQLDPLEQFFTFRTAAMAAAKSGDWRQALKYYEVAGEGAKNSSEITSKQLSLKGDIAECYIRLGDTDSAIKVLKKAVQELERLGPPQSDAQKFGRGMIWHMLHWSDDYLAGKDREALNRFAQGRCSSPDYLPDVVNKEAYPIEYFWYFLAKLELRSGKNFGIRQHIDKWDDSRKVKILEQTLSEVDLQESIKHRDIPRFVKALRDDLSALYDMHLHTDALIKGGSSNPVKGKYSLLNWKDMTLPLLPMFDKSVLKFAISCLISRDFSTYDQFVEGESELHNIPRFQELRDVLASQKQAKEKDYIAGHIARLRHFKGVLSLKDRFQSQFRLFEFLTNKPESEELASSFSAWVKREWHLMVQRRGLRIPDVTVPMIEANIASSRQGYAHSAAVFLSANAALGFVLSKEYIEILKAMAFK